MSITIPQFVLGGHSQPYEFARMEGDVSWYRQLYGPNEIPSAPQSLDRGLTAGVGFAPWHPLQPECATPEPATALLVFCGLVAAVLMRRFLS